MEPRTERPSFWERDRVLAASGVPVCPRCGERDKLMFLVGQWFCDRMGCVGFVVNLRPRPGRYVPDF